MAHQNLKFPVNPKNSQEKQPVFGGQMHGTFFMIYIIIKDYKIENDGNETWHVYTCDYYLQNFRGAITIGLVDVKNNTSFEKVEDLEEHGPILHFGLSVRPFVKKDIIADTKIRIKQPITNGQIAVTKVDLLNPPKAFFDPNDLDGSPIAFFDKNDLDSSLYINPYTHFRDGDEYDEISRRPTGDTNPFPEPSNMAGHGTGFCLADVLIFKF